MADQRRGPDWWRTVTRSPHEIDPLTWLAGNRVSLVFSGLIIIACVGSIVSLPGSNLEILAQVGALLLMAASCLVVFWFSRPPRSRFARVRIAVPIAMAGIAIIVSALNVPAASSPAGMTPIELWWAPLGAGLVLGSLVPYTSVASMLAIGSALTTITGICSVLLFANGPWPTLSTAAIGVMPLVLAMGGSAVFQYQVSKRVGRWVARKVPATVTGELLGERARLATVENELAIVSTRVKPLLADIAERGFVTEDDRAQAAALADEIRAELVERSNRSWLDLVASGRPITVVDPEHRADSMDELQRSTIHGLLLAVLDSPEVEFPQLLIELRGEAEGSTAVAITVDAGLAEGRRIMLLAPHYLSLRSAADDVSWKGGDTIRMRFRAARGTD